MKNIYDLLKNTEMPEKIENNPIKDAVVEIKFESVENIPYQAVYGMIFNEFRHDYPLNEELPITRVPEHIRMKDPGMIFQPYHVMKNDKYKLKIGPRVILIGINGKYRGWNEFKPAIIDFIEKVLKYNFIKKITRIGTRYINLFESQPEEVFKMEMLLNKETIQTEDFYHRFVFKNAENNVKTNIQLVKNAKMPQLTSKQGPVLDIDSYADGDINMELKSIEDIIEKIHHNTKLFYFGLIR
ncbi:MAG: TIGR04255 family protein [Candidatus Muiribacteriota bacterium]